MTMNKLLLALVLGAFLCTSGFAQSWKGELGGIAGVNFGNNSVTGGGFGVDAAGRIYRAIAVTGRYVYNRREQQDCLFCTSISSNVHEALGGLRVSLTPGSAIRPYVSFAAGATRFTNTRIASGAGTSNINGPGTHLAWSPGGGVSRDITDRLGVKLDVQYVKPVNLPGAGYVRAGVGFFMHFKR